MNPPVPGWEQTVSREPVCIPTVDGQGIAETLWVDVPAWRDPKTSQIFLDGKASDKLDAVKARYMGLLSPQQLRDLRTAIGVSQKGMAGLLQLGEKSWTRWESGRERPSRSMNVLLCSIFDGRLDVNYLQMLVDPTQRSQFNRWKPAVKLEDPSYQESAHYSWSLNASSSLAA